MQLARAVRNRTTGVLYVLDEPSIGLHPPTSWGLNGVMHDLIADGNSVVLVDHDTQVLAESDWLIEMGPEAGAGGGRVIAQGTVADLTANSASQIGPFLSGAGNAAPADCPAEELFAEGCIRLSTDAIHTVKPLEVTLPKGPPDRGDGGLRLRQDHADTGKPLSRRWRHRRRAPPACPREGGAGRRHPSGQAD